MDIIHQIYPSSSKGHKFILVAIDYFSKWVKAKTLKDITQNEIFDFVEEKILQRFGISKTIYTN